MDFLKEAIGVILEVVITCLAGYIGVAVKKTYSKYVNDDTKKNVVLTCVKAVEQMYKDLHGNEKLEECIKRASGILSDKGIRVDDYEIRTLIESAVKEMNDGFNKA